MKFVSFTANASNLTRFPPTKKTEKVHKIKHRQHNLPDLSLGHLGVGRVVGDIASVLAISKTDVSALTPAGAPAVSHLPVAIGASVDTNCLHAVVNLLAALGHDATAV